MIEDKDKDIKATCEFTYGELQYLLVIMIEGAHVVNESTSGAFEGFQDWKTQERIIDKIRKKCWECHYRKHQDNE